MNITHREHFSLVFWAVNAAIQRNWNLNAFFSLKATESHGTWKDRIQRRNETKREKKKKKIKMNGILTVNLIFNISQQRWINVNTSHECKILMENERITKAETVIKILTAFIFDTWQIFRINSYFTHSIKTDPRKTKRLFNLSLHVVCIEFRFSITTRLTNHTNYITRSGMECKLLSFVRIFQTIIIIIYIRKRLIL